MEISRDFSFEMSHIIPNHPGKCRRLHGHSATGTLRLIAGEYNYETGMVLDFAELKGVLHTIEERFDHKHANLFLRLPTAENFAIYIGLEVLTWLKKKKLVLDWDAPEPGPILGVEVVFRETENTTAVFNSTDDAWVLQKDKTLRGWEPPDEKLLARLTKHVNALTEVYGQQ